LVIGVRKDINVEPELLFPIKQNEKTIRQVIGDLQSLNKMGEISKNDIYHSFRKYNPEMRKWISDLKEGQSAFDNTDPTKLPHYYKNGVKVFCKKKNGDKYTFMSIPQDFQWTDKSLNELNKLNECEKQNFIKQNDINIRQSIGEAVPTTIFNQIAKNIKKYIG